MKHFFTILGKILTAIAALILLLWLLLQTSTVQNFLIQKATAFLSKKLQTKVSVGHVSLTFFNKLNLENTFIADKQQDTLLYAGALKVRITDWFFFKEQADLKYIGLEDATIKMHRKDSTWNYQFVIDFFTSSDSNTTSSNKKGLELHLQKLDLKKVSFLKHDAWLGQQMNIKVGSLYLDADDINLSKNIFKINSIEIDRPSFSIVNFKGLKPPKPSRPSSSAGKLNAGNAAVFVKILKITQGNFANENAESKRIMHSFDGSHIVVNKINGTFQNIRLHKDTITAQILLNAQERSGFILKKLQAHLRVTPHLMEFNKLNILTNKSHIENYYAMSFENFNKDMSDFENRVIMKARFRNAHVYSDDIAFFAPALASWKKNVLLSCNFTGTVADFKAENLLVSGGSGTYLSGNLSMKGLPDIHKTFIQFPKGIIQTNYADFAAIVPSISQLQSPNFQALGQFQYTGSLNGTIHQFAANGNISSAIGGLYTNVTMQLPQKGLPKYKGTVISRKFNLGKFLSINEIETISFNGNIEGTGFNIDTIRTNLNGHFNEFTFHHYAYKNIDFNGHIQNQFFNGELKIADSNFHFISNLEINLAPPQPKFNVLGDLIYSNLKSLHFTKDSFELVGLFDLNFEGKNIDEFTGSAKLLNTSLQHNGEKLSFDSLILYSYIDTANRKILELSSNEIDVRIRGQYNILDLPTSFQVFLTNYFPSYIQPPKQTPKNQRFLITIQTREFSPFAQLIDSSLSGLNYANITGGVNTKDSGIFYLKTSIPTVSYKNYKAEAANVEARGDLNSVFMSGSIEKFFISDSTFFPNTTLNIQAGSDHAIVHLNISMNNTLNKADLNADVYTMADGVKIHFQPSSFILNDKEWKLEKEGEIVLRKRAASAQNVKFTQGFQEIKVETETSADSTINNQLAIRLKNVSLGDFTPLVVQNPRIEGIGNGTVYLKNFFDNFKITSDLNVKQFRLNNDSVGVVNLQAFYDAKTKMVTYKALSDNNHYQFALNGTYNTNDSGNAPLAAHFQFNGTRVNIMNAFLSTLFNNITGEATGELSILGNFDAPDLRGAIHLKNAELTVLYTQVRYFIDSAYFQFNEGVMNFGNFQIHDSLGNKATARGILKHKRLSKMDFDFDFSTNKMLLLNTTAKDNSQFYGKAVGKATVSMKGPQENLKMTINGEINDTTHIFIPIGTTENTTQNSFIVFKEYGNEIKATKELLNETRLTVELDVRANNKAQVDVILDEVTGDVIRAVGNGRLQINVLPSGEMTMKGRYNIEQGKYDFNFQSIIKKPFELMPDANSYIEWTGDPFNAIIHVDARYTASNVSLNNLVSTQSLTGISSTVRGYRGDVYVVAQLRGQLIKPDILFHIDFPPNTPIKNDNDFALFLNRLESDQNEMLKQVTYLIVFGSFAPYGEMGAAAATPYAIGVNTISQKIASELDKLVSNLLYKITGDKSLQLDLGASTYSSATLLGTGIGSNTRLDRQSINLKLNQSLLDGKIIITFGGDFDFNLGSSTALQGSNFQWLPDISVQIILSKDRKLRAIIFNKSSLDVSTGSTSALGRRNRQGVSISYTKDFEKLFGTKPKEPSIQDSSNNKK